MGFFQTEKNVHTTATISAPAIRAMPSSGFTLGHYGVEIRNDNNQMEAPDGDLVYVRVSSGSSDDTTLWEFGTGIVEYTPGGTDLPASTHPDFPSSDGWMEHNDPMSPGIFEFGVRLVNGTHLAVPLRVTVGWFEQGNLSRVTINQDVQDSETSIGEIGDTPSLLTLMGLLGLYSDVETYGGNTGSLFSKIRNAKGVRMQRFKNHFTPVAGICDEAADVKSANLATVADLGTYVAVGIWEISLAESLMEYVGFEVNLHWTAEITSGAGAGTCKWVVGSIGANTLDALPVGTDITDEVAVPNGAPQVLTRAGRFKPGSNGFPTSNSGFELVLAAKVTVPTENITCTEMDDTWIEITYER